MFGRTILSVFFCLIPLALAGQSLTLSIPSSSSPSTYDLSYGTVSFQSSSIHFSNTGNVVEFMNYGVSPDYKLLGLLQQSASGDRAILFSTDGTRLSTFPTISLDGEDPSLEVHALNNGEMLVRDNIANFTLYDVFGAEKAVISNFSERAEGEVISEVAMDPFAETVILYTPKIKQNGSLGSKAELLAGDGSLRNIYFSVDRTIRSVHVSNNGKFIMIATAGDGGGEVILYDRHGNELNRINADDTFSGAAISDDARFLTAYSSRRVVVYEALTGERIGSTSFSKTLVKARYFPEDSIIIGVTGSYYEESGIVNDVTFHAVDLEKSALARKKLSGSILLKKQIPSRFIRTGDNHYRLTGTNKSVDMRTSF